MAPTIIYVATLWLYERMHLCTRVMPDAMSCCLTGRVHLQVKGAECVVLAGDHKQLDPFVASDEAKRLGFSESLLERLQVCLFHRMIMSLSLDWEEKHMLQGVCVCCTKPVYMLPEQVAAPSCSGISLQGRA